MRTNNKDKFLRKIIQYIINNNVKNYSDVVKYILSNDFLSSYVSKMKNSATYIENLKYDNQFKKLLKEYNLYIDRNIISHNNKKSVKKNDIQKEIEKLTLSDVIKYNDPYTQVMSNITEDSRCLTRINSYTNERTLNYILNKYFSVIKDFNDIVNKNNGKIKLVNMSASKEHIKYVIYNNNIIICNFDIYFNKYISIKFVDEVLKKIVVGIRKIYPFTHFEYTNVICLLYMLYKNNYVREVKFILFEIFNIISNFYKNKFSFSTSNIYLYKLLNKEHINEMINNDVVFIVELINMFNKIDIKCSEFLVAVYKLIVYEKNKIKRLYKNINNYMSYIKESPLKVLPLEYLDFCIQDKYYGGLYK